MSLERKDLRLKLDCDVHAGLALLADSDKCELAEWAEAVLSEAVWKRIHAARIIASKAARLGIAGNGGESAGKSGKGAE